MMRPRAGVTDQTLGSAILHVSSRTPLVPRVAIVLGSGLGALADRLADAVAIGYDSLPGFGRPMARGHRGELILGMLGDIPAVMMAGRLHRYEGYRDEQIVLPIRLMAAMGAEILIVSNAAGGLNPFLRVGDLVVIRDHIDLAYRRGSYLSVGTDSPRYPSREVYDPGLIDVALAGARAGDFRAVEGVYLATLGPSYETRAEYRMMRRLGADVVGMSTAPEARVAADLGLRVLGLSVVTNVAKPERGSASADLPTTHDEVLAVGRGVVDKVCRIIDEVMRSGIV